MLNAYLTGRQKQRFYCRSLLGKKDVDGLGNPQAFGTGCANCQGCGSPVGQLGIAGDGQIELVGRNMEIKLQWSCPSCGSKVVEDATALTVNTKAIEVAADPLCHRCRRS